MKQGINFSLNMSLKRKWLVLQFGFRCMSSQVLKISPFQFLCTPIKTFSKPRLFHVWNCLKCFIYILIIAPFQRLFFPRPLHYEPVYFSNPFLCRISEVKLCYFPYIIKLERNTAFEENFLHKHIYAYV